MRQTPMTAAIQARCAHSHRNGRCQGGCWPPRSAGAVSTLALLLRALEWRRGHMAALERFERTTPGQIGLLGAPDRPQIEIRIGLVELDGDVAVPVGADCPGRGDVAVRPQDVGPVLRA